MEGERERERDRDREREIRRVGWTIESRRTQERHERNSKD